MNSLFSKGGLTVLESLTFTQSLFAFDFDGTLAPIVKVPEEAKMRETTNRLLKELSQLAPVAIISGRSLEDLKERLDFSPHYLIGNHGLEGLSRFSKNSLPKLELICEAWRRSLKQSSFLPGMHVEDKAYSLALHYRRCRNKTKARALIENALSKLEPAPRVIPGKCVINLLPPEAPHKGIALVELMKRAQVKSALYIGDDDTDEDVFALGEPGVLSVRVGKKIKSQASFFLDRQSDINRLLKAIIKFYKTDIHR